MDAKSVRNMYSIIAVINKHIAKLHHVGFLYILTYDARKLKHKIQVNCLKNDFEMYIKIDIKTAPTCFRAVTPSSGSALFVQLHHHTPMYFSGLF